MSAPYLPLLCQEFDVLLVRRNDNSTVDVPIGRVRRIIMSLKMFGNMSILVFVDSHFVLLNIPLNKIICLQ